MTQSDTGPGNTNSRSRCWFLTWNNPPDTADTDILRLGADKYCYQLEKGTNGTLHIQGVLYFKNARRFHSLKKELPAVHWEVARNLKHCIEYCSKLDTRVGDTRVKGFKIIEPIITIDREDMEEWQEGILDIMEQQPHKRRVYWYWDVQGGTGKTEFCKWCFINMNRVLYLNGKSNDMKFAVTKYVELNGHGPTTIMMDFPRDYQRYVSYIGIEELKNGIFFSGKYESCSVVYNTPHIFCFANFPPNLDSLSMDRWDITNIEDTIADSPHD